MAVKKIIHFYRADANKSSRIFSQLQLDDGEVLDELRLLDFKVFFRFLRSKKNDVFIFHQQSSLVNLFLCVFLNLFFNKIKLIYDMHDLLEYDGASSLKSKISFYIFSILEKVVFISAVKVITVSDGLSRICYLKYKKRPTVFYNIPAFDFHIDNGCIRKSKNKDRNFVYFGLINEKRLPVSLLEYLKKKGVTVDVYGIFDTNLTYKRIFSRYEKDKVLNYKGEYSPETIIELVSTYKYSLVYFPSTNVNIRFCLPNKLFQSLAAGTKCIVSNNLAEVSVKFRSTGAVVYLSEIDKERGECFDSVVNAINIVNKMKEISHINYRKVVGIIPA